MAETRTVRAGRLLPPRPSPALLTVVVQVAHVVIFAYWMILDEALDLIWRNEGEGEAERERQRGRGTRHGEKERSFLLH